MTTVAENQNARSRRVKAQGTIPPGSPNLKYKRKKKYDTAYGFTRKNQNMVLVTSCGCPFLRAYVRIASGAFHLTTLDAWCWLT